MEVRNETGLEQALTIGPGPSREPVLSVIVKGTFDLPREENAIAELADEQIPVAEGDEYHEDPDGSVRIESEMAPFKPRTDLVVVGAAHAPGGEPAQVVNAGLRVGDTGKVIRVVGNRVWWTPRGRSVPRATEPEPFATMPLVYERAFGGLDQEGGGWCQRNPVGVGYLEPGRDAPVEEVPLPNLEDPAAMIQGWTDHPRPTGFGFYGRSWEPRRSAGGTEEGTENPDPVFGLPEDFTVDFFNGAHPDLQVPGYLGGDEWVDTRHLTPEGRRRFRLPGLAPRVVVETGSGGDAAGRPEAGELDLHLDTLVFVTEEEIFCQVWRGQLRLGERVEEAIQAIDRIGIE